LLVSGKTEKKASRMLSNRFIFYDVLDVGALIFVRKDNSPQQKEENVEQTIPRAFTDKSNNSRAITGKYR
jgi:hypothetical protein